jgi:hypothetical protein
MTESGLFGSTSAPYGNFKGLGTHYEGTVISVGQVQSRKYVPANQRAAGKQGELEFWPDGQKKMTAIITIQTDQRDPSIEGDDGARSIWVKGKSMTDAVKAAVSAAGARREGIVPGGYFSITFTHETPPEFDDASPTKHYAVEYRKPAQSASDEINIVGGAQAPATTPQAPQGGPAGSYAPSARGSAPVDAAPVPVSAAAATPAFDPSQLAGMTPEAMAALQAMLAQQQGAGK